MISAGSWKSFKSIDTLKLSKSNGSSKLGGESMSGRTLEGSNLRWVVRTDSSSLKRNFYIYVVSASKSDIFSSSEIG